MDFFLAILLASAGIKTEVTYNAVGKPAPTIEKASPSLVSYIRDELKSDYFTMSDIDPKAFDFKPSEDEENAADYASIKFLSKLLYAHNNEDPIASVDRVPLDPDSQYDKENMMFVPEQKGRTNASNQQSIVNYGKNGKVVINNLPRENALPTKDTPQIITEEKAFHIDLRPVTNRDYRKFIQATGRKPPSHWQNGSLSSAIKDDPVVNVSIEDAKAYATWAGHRLPTYSEFQRAIKKSPDIRQGAPLREWTSTPSNQDKLAPRYYIVGGKEMEGATEDQQTGFRTATDD